CLKRPESGDWPVELACEVEGLPASWAETARIERREARRKVANFILHSLSRGVRQSRPVHERFDVLPHVFDVFTIPKALIRLGYSMSSTPAGVEPPAGRRRRSVHVDS